MSLESTRPAPRLEPNEGVRISGYMLRQKLGRDETVETSILSFVDDSHPAATEFLNDAVMRDVWPIIA